MIDRGTLLRGFIALFIIAVVGGLLYSLLSNTDGSSGNFPEDDGDKQSYGPIFEDPDAWQNATLADKFIRDMKVTGGGTFGATIVKQVRIDIDGSGPIPKRDVTLQTRPAVKLFNGPTRGRSEAVLRGIQRILDERGGLVEGISFASTKGGLEAAAISAMVETYHTDDVTTQAERDLVLMILDLVAKEQTRSLYAWYDFRFQQIVFGPEISNGALKWIRTPKRTKPAENIFTAYIMRHELEHAITPPTDEEYQRFQWLEEGTADVIARWPGVAADTAEDVGMTYPKRYERLEYSTDLGGYPDFTIALRMLLGAAGIDWKDPEQIDEAYAMLQERDLTEVPGALAERIAKRDRLSRKERARIERAILRVDGSPAKARRLVASLQ